MSVRIDVVTQYAGSIDEDDLPNNRDEMNHEEKDEWIEEEELQYDNKDIMWHEDGN